MSSYYSIIFAANETGEDEVASYIRTLARKRVTGAFEATELFEKIKELQIVGPSANEECQVGGTIMIHLLAHEQHRVAYATSPAIEASLVLLTAFHEREKEEGLMRATRIAKLIFSVDSS
jgi:hypothetical protein